MLFPTMNLDGDHVPIGDSVEMCMGLSWIIMSKRRQYDKFINFRNMPECDIWKHERS